MNATTRIPVLGNASPRRPEVALYGIYEISKILAGLGNLREMLSATLAVLSGFLDMNFGLIALLDAAGDPEMTVCASGDSAGARAYFNSLPEQVVGQIVVTEIPVVVENVGTDTNFPWNTAGWLPADANFSFCGVPIKDRDRTIGILTIDRPWTVRPSPALDDDVRFLKMVANLVGQTVRLHRMVARDRDRLLEEQRRMAHELEQRGSEGGLRPARIIGQSTKLTNLLEKLKVVANTDTPVLLRGESGTGKELFAQALHDLSRRRKKAFVKLNCAALPESVLESELFGHERGAFTGALTMRKGRFETADGGTLFLDEIGEISASFQAKLLRVLQEGEFERVGSSRTQRVDVRIITATNRDLEDAVSKGTFRADLYYRIAVVPLALPPLRDRNGDIPLLAAEFLRRFNGDNGTHYTLAPSAVAVLESCYFPGNVRELENCIRRTATLAGDKRVLDRDFDCRNDGCLSSVLWRAAPAKVTPAPEVPAPAPAPQVPEAAQPGPDGVAGNSASGQAVLHAGKAGREALIQAMEKSGWIQTRAARLLGLTPRQIGYALRKHNIPAQAR
jgi:Nif-specific regulatory protein